MPSRLHREATFLAGAAKELEEGAAAPATREERGRVDGAER